MKNINRFYPYILSILGFVVVSLIYFYPVLQGREIYQSDIAQYTGMAKEQNDFRKETGEEPYWTNSAFGGMPTYQLGAHYPHNYIKTVDSVLRFLPRPADYLFLYFLGFFILLRALKIDVLKAFFGALAFGLSTYLIIILGVGHNAKAHAIAYMPMVVAGVIMVFQRRYIAGGLLTLIAAALEINANHFQMTFYLLLLLIVIGIYYIIQIVKAKEYKHLGYTLGLFAVAGILALGANATNLMATSEYAKFSTRSDSELTFNPDGSKKESSNAMSYEYITEYSYGIAESLNLVAPRLFGGSNSEKLGDESEVYQFILGKGATPAEANDFTGRYGATYWGDQPIVAAPAYIGAVVFFLFVLAMFVEKRTIKYAFLAGAILSLFLSWGKNFPVLTNFFIEYFPMYNKFRAVSSIQVILELCMPVLAVMGLYAFFNETDKGKQWKSLWRSAAISLGLLVLLFLFKGMFSFSGAIDAQLSQLFTQMGDPSFGIEFIDALKADRKSLYSADLLRSFFLITVVALILWAYTKDKLKYTTAVVLAGLVMVFDLYFIDKRYVDSSDFVSSREVNVPFEPTPADMQVMEDKSHFRVFDLDGGLNSARASYFHKSIGGYHAAKPRKIQQLFDYQISKQPINVEVLNMLNVKYALQTNEEGQVVPIPVNTTNGPAWFISEVKLVNSADEEMRALDKLNTKTTAVVNKVKFPDALQKSTFAVDSTATIKLVAYEPNYLQYTSNNRNEGLAAFSEVYYGNGWNAYIDGSPEPHFEANYVLRALQLPAGEHKIEFKFEPQVVKTGSTIALISFLIILLLTAGGIYVYYKRRQTHEKNTK